MICTAFHKQSLKESPAPPREKHGKSEAELCDALTLEKMTEKESIYSSSMPS